MSPDVRAAGIALLGAALCGGLANQAQRVADEVRFAEDAREEQIFLPDPRSLQVASMGFHGLISELLWVRSVLHFADLMDHPSPEGARWLRVMIQTVTTLDPGWRSSYMYGGAMLRALADYEGSDAVFEDGARNLPEDPTFPFALAMNAFLYEDKVEEAVKWMEVAAALPTAPPWYRRAAAGFYDKRGQRKAALRYLEEEIATEADPSLRAELDHKYREVLHDELAEQIAQRRAEVQGLLGREIQRVQELGELPPDPLGGTWILAPDGEVRSSVRDAVLADRARRAERQELFRLWEGERKTP